MLLCKSNVQFVATFLQVVKSLLILLLQPARNEFCLALLASRGSKFFHFGKYFKRYQREKQNGWKSRKS